MVWRVWVSRLEVVWEGGFEVGKMLEGMVEERG